MSAATQPASTRRAIAVSERLAAAGLDWVVPQWPAPRAVQAFFTTRNAVGRRGGHTSSLDVGSPSVASGAATDEAIAENRRIVQAFLPSTPIWLDQVHGATVIDIDRSGRSSDDRWPRADATVTRATDVVLAIRVADCLPALFTAADGSVIGAAHAGWRGLAAGVLESTVAAMGCNPSDILAWLGPCIGAAAYEVGDDVRDAFVTRDTEAASAFERGRPGKWQANLEALARRRLAEAGVVAMTSAGMCTASDPARFFSFRRDGTSGRMAAFIWRNGC